MYFERAEGAKHVCSATEEEGCGLGTPSPIMQYIVIKTLSSAGGQGGNLTICDLLQEKGPSRIFINIDWIDSSVCAEYNGASFKDKS